MHPDLAAKKVVHWNFRPVGGDTQDVTQVSGITESTSKNQHDLRIQKKREQMVSSTQLIHRTDGRAWMQGQCKCKTIKGTCINEKKETVKKPKYMCAPTD